VFDAPDYIDAIVDKKTVNVKKSSFGCSFYSARSKALRNFSWLAAALFKGFRHDISCA